MRLSYLRYVLKGAVDPVSLLEQESMKLHLTAKFKGLLEQFVPVTTKRTAKHALAV